MTKKISVIVNCHNGEKFLNKCISSILNQKYQNFEIIFYDNFSSDNSKKILDNFKDERIKYFYSGIKFPLYKARNEAIKKTSGSLIAFLDVDDWWDEEYLSSRSEIFSDTSYDFYYCNSYFFYEKNKIFRKYKNYSLPSGKIFDQLAQDYFIIISGLIIKKKIFDNIGHFNSDYNIIGDFDFVMKMSIDYKAHSYIKPMVFYRSHNNNFSKLNSEMLFYEFKEWYENNLKLGNEDFFKNKEYFYKKLLFLEVNYLLLNKRKNFSLLKKIFSYPEVLQMLKFLIGFMLPKKIIKMLKK